MIKTLFLGLLMALSVNASANSKCESPLITPKFQLFIDEHSDHQAYIRSLEREIDARIRKKGMPIRPTQVQGIRNYEQVMFLLSQGDSKAILPIVRASAYNVDEAHKNMQELAKTIHRLQQVENPSDDQLKELVNAELEFLGQVQTFGDSFGATKKMLQLFESVAKGEGVPRNDDFVDYTGPVDDDSAEVVLDLSGDHSIHAAQSIRHMVWEYNRLAPSAEIKESFENNLYALRAKLERDLNELKTLDRWSSKAVKTLSWLVTTSTDKIPFLPEKYRQFFMGLAGMQVDQFMRDLYVGRVQRLVNITRRRTPDGKLVIIKDPKALATLAVSVKEQVAATWANDLLTTYARLGYFSKSWKQLKEVIEQTAKSDPMFSTMAKNVADAQKGAISAGDLVYVYEKDTNQQAQLLIAQAVYLAAVEEYTVGGVHKYLWPILERLFH